jgi:OOP family OmpA-OmpF porin
MNRLTAWILAIVAWSLLAYLCIYRLGNDQGLTPQSPVAANPSLPALQVVRDAQGQWILTGAVPNESARQALVKQVQERLGVQSVVDQLALVSHAPLAPADFPPDVSTLSHPKVSWKDGRWTIAGMVPKHDQLLAFRQSLPAEVLSNLDDQMVVDMDGAQRLLDEMNAVVANSDFGFVTASAELTASAKERLDQVARLLVQLDDTKVEITGHTDDVGTEAGNLALSQARADHVRQYLVAHGVAAQRLTAKGYGQQQPRQSNATPEGRAKNRRIEFRFN